MNNQKSLIKWLFKTPMMTNVYIKFVVFNNNLLTEIIIKYEELLSRIIIEMIYNDICNIVEYINEISIKNHLFYISKYY